MLAVLGLLGAGPTCVLFVMLGAAARAPPCACAFTCALACACVSPCAVWIAVPRGACPAVLVQPRTGRGPSGDTGIC